MEKDIVIDILYFGKTNLLEKGNGVKFEEIKDYLITKGYTFETAPDIQKIYNVLSNSFKYHGQPDQRYVINIDSYFSLLEHEELQEARRSSKQANRWAIIALLISILTAGLSIYYSKLQIDTPVEIKQDQIDSLINSNMILHLDNLKIEQLIITKDSLAKDSIAAKSK